MPEAIRKLNGWLYALLGAAAFLMFMFLPLTVAAMLIFGVFWVVFSFFKLEASMGVFIAAMLMVPHPLWNNAYLFLAAVFYALVYSAQIVAGKRIPPSIKSLNPAFCVFIIVALFSLFTSRDFSDSLRIFMILASGFIFTVILRGVITTRKDVNLMVMSLFVAMFVTSAYGLLQYALGIEIRPEFVDLRYHQGLARLYSTLDNPNNFAKFLLLTLPVCAAYTAICKHPFKKFVMFGMVMVGIAALGLTFSRSAYLALGASLGVFVFFTNRRAIPFVLVFALLAIPFLPSAIMDRMTTIGQDTSSMYRLRIWEGTWFVIRGNWLLGIGLGPGAFTNAYNAFAIVSETPAMHSHNQFLQIWVELGLAGLISFVVMMFTAIKRGFWVHARAVSRTYKLLIAALASSLVGIIVMGMVEYVWYYPRLMFMFWVIMGIFFAVVNLANGDRENPQL